jgi:hypothetical protein
MEAMVEVMMGQQGGRGKLIASVPNLLSLLNLHSKER